MNELVVCPTLFSLSLSFAIGSSWSEPVSSWSCFCSLYGVSPTSTAKNIINLISGDIHVQGILSCCCKRMFAMTSTFSLQNSVSLWPTSFCTPRPNCLLLQVSLDFLLLHSNPLWWKAHLFLVSVLEVFKVFIEPFNFSFFGLTGWGTDLDYCDVEGFALETNWDHSVIFEIAPKY